MAVRYGGVIFKRQHFTVFGESRTIFVSPTRLWTIIHKVMCWMHKRKVKNVLKHAQVSQTRNHEFLVQIDRLYSLNKKLDCYVEMISAEINFTTRSIYLSMVID